MCQMNDVKYNVMSMVNNDIYLIITFGTSSWSFVDT